MVARSIQLLAIVFAFALVTACGDRGKLYQRPIDDVRTVLGGMDELPPVFGSNEPDVSVDSSDPSQVAWVLRMKGSEMMRFVAKLESEGQASTRVKLSLAGVTDGPFGNVEQRLKDHSEVRDLYLVAMNEQISSTLENREFDATKIMAATIRASAANIGTISNQMESAGKAARERDEANIRNAYADEAAGH